MYNLLVQMYHRFSLKNHLLSVCLPPTPGIYCCHIVLQAVIKDKLNKASKERDFFS
jgi:hypothetical protein